MLGNEGHCAIVYHVGGRFDRRGAIGFAPIVPRVFDDHGLNGCPKSRLDRLTP